ncbi:MAG: hypothetical protein GC192_03590 [Bacteroidetes bacterium]|nr:hypothetical protein [Bacteroidota bacterium]
MKFKLTTLILLLVLKATSQTFTLEDFSTGYSYLVGIAHPPGDDRLFAFQKDGLIKIVNVNGTQGGTFLDIGAKLTNVDEYGLVGLAFHPNYASNGRFFVFYNQVGTGDCVIARYSRSASDPNVADPNSEVILLTFPHPESHHVGGCMKFGQDGYLYIATGDGNGPTSPPVNAQNLQSYLGKILRIDVNNGATYTAPNNNPFIGNNNALPEIWAYGLRNPWRFSFDKYTGDMWIADVGQDNAEEIDFQPINSIGGQNYGWACMEGTQQFNTSQCNGNSNYTAPIFEYNHNNSDCSINGGIVYRGGEYADLFGKYIYTDFCSGKIWALDNSGTQPVAVEGGDFNNTDLTMIEENDQGDLFAVGFFTNKIYRIKSQNCAPVAFIEGDAVRSLPNGGNLSLSAYPVMSGYSYQWLFNGNPIANQTNAVLSVTQSGNYTLQVTNPANGCLNTSAAVTVTSGDNGISFDCPADLTVQAGPVGSPGPCNDGAPVSLPLATTDCATGDLSVVLSSYNVLSGNITVDYPGGSCGPIYIQGTGSVQLHFTATDACGNTANCSYQFTREAVQHTVQFTNCPIDIQVTATAGANGAVVSWPNLEVAQTGCPSGSGTPSPIQLLGLPSGSTFPVGTTEVGFHAYSCFDQEAFCFFNVTVQPSGTGSNQIDLALTLDQLNTSPSQWSNYAVKATIANTGPQAATGVQVKFAKPNGVVYVGGNEFTASQGTFNPNGDEVWTVGSLPASGSATLTVNYFLLNTSSPVAYAQVIAANETDSDSQPNNGTPPTVNEDDEANTAGGSIPTCSISAIVTDAYCNDNNTSANPADDEYGFSVTVTGSNTGNQGWEYVGQGYPPNSNAYGTSTPIGNFFISNGPVSFLIRDKADQTCFTNITVQPPAPCSNGSTLPDFELVYFTAIANVNGQYLTVSANDTILAGSFIDFVSHFANLDFPQPLPTFILDISGYLSTDAVLDAGDILLASGSRTIDASVQMFGFTEGGFGQGIIPASTPSGNYFIITKYDSGDIQNESDETNNLIALPVSIINGGGNGDIDLELSLVQPNTSPAQWSNYSVIANVKNTGSEPATGVKISFKKPTGVVYVGGNEFTASQGSFNPNGDEIWTVGNIPANSSATLTVNYFLLNTSVPVAYAQVIAANETDSDSQPNNGTPPTVNEDDEASTGSNPPSGLTPDLTISNLQIPNPTVQAGQVLNYSFNAANIGTGNATGNFNIKAWISAGQAISPDDVQVGIVMTGNYPAGFSQADIPGASTIPANLAAGQYYLILWMDADEVVTESNESNNIIYKTFTVESGNNPLPDLTIPNLNINNSTIQTGQTLSYTYNIDNIGAGQVAGALSILAYFSTDGNLSSDDIQAGVNTINIVPGAPFPSGTYQGSAAVTLGDGSYFLILKIDDGNAIAESDENNNTVLKPFTVIGGAPDCSAINITSATGQITIDGASAPHVLLKVFKPNWTVAYECLDGQCANPTVVTGLSTGSHYVEVKLMSNSWGEICKVQEFISVTSFNNGGTNSLVFKNNRQRLAFDKIYPNPAQYNVTLEVYSKDDQHAVFDIYDQIGREVQHIEMELKNGRNELELFVEEWKSGTYNIIGRGESGLPAYGRFMKVWEE